MGEDIYREQLVGGEGHLITVGNVIFDIHPSAKIELNADFSVGHNLRAGSNAETYVKLHENSHLVVNGFFKAFFGTSIEVFEGATLTLYSGFINTGGVISCASNIIIKEGAAIARNVCIYDADHHVILDENDKQKNLSRPVIISEHVWIGMGAIILKGVTINEGSVIAAGAVVTHDVPPKCIVAGTPARVVRENVEWR